MKKALVLNEKVVQTSAEPFEVAAPLEWHDCGDEVESGYSFDGQKFIAPDRPTDEESTANNLKQLRQARNKRLENCDWTQLPDAPITDSKRGEWANYRQALRDITESFQSLKEEGFAWPTEPSA